MTWLILPALFWLAIQGTWADPPPIASITKCPANTESPKKGICCRKSLPGSPSQKVYGEGDCVFHGPIVYGDSSQSHFAVITYEYGRLMGPRWEIAERRIQSIQNYEDSVAVGLFQEFDRDGQLFIDGTKNQEQLTGQWRIHYPVEKKTYRVSFSSPAGNSPIEICKLQTENCEIANLSTQEEVAKHQEAIEQIVGLYRPSEPLSGRHFATQKTSFLPLRLGPKSNDRLVGVIVENRLVTSWNAYHPFTYLDKDLGFVPVAKRDSGSCLVQMLPLPLPWIWIPCTESQLNLEKTLLSYQWAAPANPSSLSLGQSGSDGDLKDIREVVALGLMSVKPTRLVETDGKQWIEGTLTDFVRDLAWEISSEETEARKRLSVKSHAGKIVRFPLVFDNRFNFLPLAHN